MSVPGAKLLRTYRRPVYLGVVLLTLAVALVVLARGDFRRFVAEGIGQETKHRLIALASLPLNPPPDTADMVPIAHTDVPPYAINVFLEQEVEERKVRESLRLIRAAGFRMIKQQLVWGEIERPAKGRFEDPNAPNHDAWAKYDRIVDLASEYGLEVIFRVDTSPEWARPGKSKLESPPRRPDDFGDFVATVAERYRGRVRYYQIWNEPNLSFEWGDEPPSAHAYVALLKVAYERAKAANPEAVIITAALAPTIEHSERAISDLTFLQQMYDAGARPYFDVLSANAYGLRHGPDDRRLGMERDMNFSRPVLLRALMVRNGDAAKPIWAAELGWVALPPGFPEEPRYGQVTRDTQARYTVRAYRRAQEEWPWMGVMALWHFRLVHPRDQIQQHYYFNVVDEGFQPYPVYEAMRDLTAEPPVLHRGYHKPTHWALTATGTWSRVADPRASLGHALVGQPGATLRFTFEGDRLRIASRPELSGGRLAVTIDGQSVPLAVSSWYRGAVVLAPGVTQSDGLAVTTVFDKSRLLATGRHEVELRVLDGPVALDGVVVEAPTPYQAFLYDVLRGAVALGVVGWYGRRWIRLRVVREWPRARSVWSARHAKRRESAIAG